VKFGKKQYKVQTGGVDLKANLNKIHKVPVFPPSAFADMTL